MKTAMQELMYHLDFIDTNIEDYENFAILSTNNVRSIIKGLKLLEKEKEQIINAVDDTRHIIGDDFDWDWEYTDGEEYYNKKYNHE